MDRLLEKHGEYTAERGFGAVKTVEQRVKMGHFRRGWFGGRQMEWNLCRSER